MIFLIECYKKASKGKPYWLLFCMPHTFTAQENYRKSDSTDCGAWLACANIAVAAC